MVHSKVFQLLLAFIIFSCVNGYVRAQTEEDIRRLQQRDRIYDKQLAKRSPSPLKTYFDEYEAVLKGRAHTPLTTSTVSTMLSTAQCVMQGDFHLAPQSQEMTINILEMMSAGEGHITVVLEWIDVSFQKEVDAYLANKYDDEKQMLLLEQLKKDIHYETCWSFPWENYYPILLAIKRLDAAVLLTDNRIHRPGIRVRDKEAAEAICKLHKEKPLERLLVVYGETHLLGSDHLSEKMAIGGFQPDIIMNGRNEKLFWRALEKYGKFDTMAFLDLGDLIFEDGADPYKTSTLIYFLAGNPVDRKRARLMSSIIAKKRDASGKTKELLEDLELLKKKSKE